MKYITKFTDHAAYSAAESSLVEPNVSYCVNENEVHYKPIPSTPTGAATAPLYEMDVNGLYRVVDAFGRLIVFNAGSSIIHLARRSNVQNYSYSGEPLELPQTDPIEYHSGYYTYTIGDYSIIQPQSMSITITPNPAEW